MNSTILHLISTLKIKAPILILTCLFSSMSLLGQTVFWSEDFETDGTGTRYSASDQFIDQLDGGVEDFFGRIEYNGGSPRVVDLPCAGGPSAEIDITNPFGAPNGNFFMAGEDMNDALTDGGCGTFNTGSPVRNIIFTGINITGTSMITGKILVANGASDGCNTTPARWDLGEGLKVFIDVDGTGETPVLCFAPTITCGSSASNSNEPLYTDDASSTGGACSGDGTGGTFVNSGFTEYDFDVTAGTGFNTLDLRIEIDADASDEEIAFDFIRLLSDTGPLDVELISFDAHENENNVNLTWSTASETQNDFFQIEQSSDGKVFTTIGIVKGMGTTQNYSSYFFQDKNPRDGLNYYRLKQVNFDGTFKYSRLETVNVISSSSGIAVSPNPFNDRFQLKLKEVNQRPSKIYIVNIMGQIVYTEIIGRGQRQKELNLSHLESGVYQLVANINGKRYEKRVSKF